MSRKFGIFLGVLGVSTIALLLVLQGCINGNIFSPLHAVSGLVDPAASLDGARTDLFSGDADRIKAAKELAKSIFEAEGDTPLGIEARIVFAQAAFASANLDIADTALNSLNAINTNFPSTGKSTFETRSESLTTSAASITGGSGLGGDIGATASDPISGIDVLINGFGSLNSVLGEVQTLINFFANFLSNKPDDATTPGMNMVGEGSLVGTLYESIVEITGVMEFGFKTDASGNVTYENPTCETDGTVCVPNIKIKGVKKLSNNAVTALTASGDLGALTKATLVTSDDSATADVDEEEWKVEPIFDDAQLRVYLGTANFLGIVGALDVNLDGKIDASDLTQLGGSFIQKTRDDLTTSQDGLQATASNAKSIRTSILDSINNITNSTGSMQKIADAYNNQLTDSTKVATTGTQIPYTAQDVTDISDISGALGGLVTFVTSMTAGVADPLNNIPDITASVLDLSWPTRLSTMVTEIGVLDLTSQTASTGIIGNLKDISADIINPNATPEIVTIAGSTDTFMKADPEADDLARVLNNIVVYSVDAIGSKTSQSGVLFAIVALTDNVESVVGSVQGRINLADESFKGASEEELKAIDTSLAEAKNALEAANGEMKKFLGETLTGLPFGEIKNQLIEVASALDQIKVLVGTLINGAYEIFRVTGEDVPEEGSYTGLAKDGGTIDSSTTSLSNISSTLSGLSL